MIVWPSASLRATYCAAMSPPAPSLFSTMTVCPRLACRFSAMMGAILSDALPGETPETRWMVLLGNACHIASPATRSRTGNAVSGRDPVNLRMASALLQGASGFRQSQLRRHPVGGAQPIAIGAVVGDVVAVFDHQQLDRTLRLRGDALRILPRHESILL